MSPCPIYTAGYIGRTVEGLQRAVEELDALLVDIRYSPRSVQPAWRQEALVARFGDRYRWLPSFGNVNYRGGPIAIADLESGLATLRLWCPQQPLVLLCACADPATCHRAVVGEACRSAGYAVSELWDRPPAQPDSYKALSLTQPWATLVAIGAKRNETRSWATSYRGDLAIHAAKTLPREARDTCYYYPFCDVLHRAGYALPGYPEHEKDEHYPTRELPLGAVLCIVTLRDCVRTEDLAHRLDEQERAFGDYTPGRFAWLLEDVRPLPEPVPARGSLGLWDWEPPTGLAERVGM